MLTRTIKDFSNVPVTARSTQIPNKVPRTAGSSCESGYIVPRFVVRAYLSIAGLQSLCSLSAPSALESDTFFLAIKSWIYIIYTLIRAANLMLLVHQTSKFKMCLKLSCWFASPIKFHPIVMLKSQLKRAAQTPQTQKVPIRCPHQNQHVPSLRKPSAFGLSLLHRLAMSVLHRRTSNYISEFGLCRASNLFFSCLLCLQCHISGTSNISKHSDTFEPSWV